MNSKPNLWRALLLGSVFSSNAFAQADDGNMVMVPIDTPIAHTQAAAAPVMMPEDNMVLVPSSATPSFSGDNVYVPVTSPNYVEAGINFHSVSANQGDWFGQFITAQYQTDPYNRWNATVQHQEAFNDEGTLVGIGNTHTFNEDWFSDVGVTFGTEANFLTRFRTDASINRRFDNLITTFGLSYSRAENTYYNVGAILAATYYFQTAPFVISGGIRADRVYPGGVYGYSPFLALTHGYQKRYMITGRIGWSREGYQILGGGNVINRFNSHGLGLSWRQWVGDDWGFNLGTEYYTNPAYNRVGGIASVFKEF